MLELQTPLSPSLRTFVFQQQQTQQSTIIDYSLDLSLNFINLNSLLGQYCPPHHHTIAIYDPNLNRFVKFEHIGAENGFLHREYLEPKIVLIRYRKRTHSAHDSDSVDSSLEQDSLAEKKDGRSKERTLAEVIELVKKWRNLHMHGHRTLRRRLNLQDAAKITGISKKSLDDYYCQLRLGEFYEFDFASNLHEKIGVLRTFVKEHKDKHPTPQQKRKQNQKHPKTLRVIQHFHLESKSLVIPQDEQKPQIMQSQNPSSYHPQPPFNVLDDPLEQLQQNSNHVYEQLFNLQHDFFKGFQLALDDANDPYNSIDRDFRKKDFEEQSNSFLYF